MKKRKHFPRKIILLLWESLKLWHPEWYAFCPFNNFLWWGVLCDCVGYGQSIYSTKKMLPLQALNIYSSMSLLHHFTTRGQLRLHNTWLFQTTVKMINHQEQKQEARQKWGRAHRGKINIHKLKRSWVERAWKMSPISHCTTFYPSFSF